MAVSVRDVAQRAGVSVGTVSNVLNAPGKVTGATAERVHAAIAELGFVPNAAARQLRAGRSATVGFVVLDVANPFFTDVARAAERRAEAEGWSVLLADSGEDAAREAAHLALFERQRVDGMLVSPVGADAVRHLGRLRDRGVAVVLVDRLAGDPAFSSVSVDDVEGGRLAAEHLLATGRRRFAFVGDPGGLVQVRDRLEGARRAVAAVPDARIDVLPASALTVREGVAAGRAILGHEERPEGVLAANDLLALGVLQAVGLIGGVAVPADLAVVGYDDIEFAASAAVPITSVRQPRDEIGATAVELLIEALAGESPRQVVLQPELVVRESTDGFIA